MLRITLQGMAITSLGPVSDLDLELPQGDLLTEIAGRRLFERSVTEGSISLTLFSKVPPGRRRYAEEGKAL